MASDSEEKYSRTPDLGSSKPQSSEERTHNDEEKGPSSHVIDEPKVDRIDPAIEKRVVRKLDLRVMTLVCGLCMFSNPPGVRDFLSSYGYKKAAS